MRLTENIYQVSGIAFGFNSNMYVIDAGDELVLIDTGYSPKQWDVMIETLVRWHLQDKPITHTLITHAHFDHSGNAWISKQMGSILIAGPGDSKSIAERGDSTLFGLFPQNYTSCTIDEIAHDGDRINVGNVEIEVISLPGHSEGSLAFQVMSGGLKCLFVGDFLTILSASPEDEVKIELGWQGSPDFNLANFKSSLERATHFDVDCILPGHLSAYFGDCQHIFKMAYEKANKELN